MIYGVDDADLLAERADDDEINMSELEELMDEISLEEEIEDEISTTVVRAFTHLWLFISN